jgi:FrmR/RcnR family transcriptional regulator, repressor of frmRAB operon
VAWEDRVLNTIRERIKMVNRVRRIRGQVDAIERAFKEEIDCPDMLRLIASVRGAVSSLMVEVLEDHIRTRIVDPSREPDAARALATKELIEVVQSYLK